MSISDQFELFVLYFEDKFSKYKPNNWDGFKGQWSRLKSDILQYILDELKYEYDNKNCTYSDTYLYQQHIFYNAKSKIDEYIKKEIQNG